LEYKEYELNELLPYEQPQAYIVESTQYSDAYKTPVLTAGKSFILGYTNETEGIFEDLPVIIFDDFTTATQFVNFKFKVKSSAMKILHINTDLVLPKYIYYKLQTIHIDHSTHKRYWIQQYSKIKVAVPSIPEQQRIVSRIEELFSSLDNAVETLQKTKEQLAVYRQAVLKEAFEGKYTPDVSMIEIAMDEITDGKEGLRRGPFGSAIKKAFFVESGYKVYEQGNAINDDCKRGHYYISEEKYNELSSFQLRPGDFIVSCSGTIGKIAQLPANAEAGVINQALMRIRLKPEMIDPYYFMLQFRSEGFQRKIVSRGSGMGNLAGIKEFKMATMFVPENREKQEYIVAEIESRMSVCDSIEQTVNTALLQAEAMRQSILKEAFEGRL
jgi:type I restriction enzyme S subunit